MRTKLDRALLAASLTTFAFALVACSSGDDNTDTGNDAGIVGDAGDASHPVDSSLPPVDSGDAGKGGDTSSGGHDSDASDASDAPVVDASDAGDAGDTGAADAGAPGSPCPTANLVQTQACGACGTQERVCLPASVDNPDAGNGLVWQPWGFCQGQPANACVPGDLSSEPCGLCGHRQRICQLDCQYAYAACEGEPANKCTPGSTSYVGGLSCDGGGREQTCQNDCTFGPFGDCEEPPYGKPVVIAGNIGGVMTTQEYLSISPTIPALQLGDCPASLVSTTAQNAYLYIEVRNPSALTATVSIWFTKATNGADIATEIAVYDGAFPPSTPTLRSACNVNVNDSCFSSIPTACQASWGGLVIDDFIDQSVTIPPNSSVTVFAAAVEEVTSTLPHSGPFLLNTRTEKLQ